ncbi:MAG: HD domain-containing protein [Candidatus Odinarchaeia archaeon]
MRFSDYIHGKIELDELESELINTDIMQSLKGKITVGNIKLLYPTAKSTRFEHSLGVYFQAKRILKQLAKHKSFTKEILKIVRLTALLHDIGHGPFSHGSENGLQEITGLTHEQTGQRIILDKNSVINQKLSDAGIDKTQISIIADMILGVNTENPFMGEIIHWLVDADKLDYLLRDSYTTNFLPSLVNSSEIISAMHIANNHIVFEEKAIPYIELMGFAETIYYLNIYHHPIIRKADHTLSRAIKIAINKHNVSPSKIQMMTDPQLLEFLMNCGGKPKELVNRIKTNQLKTILVSKINNFNVEQFNILMDIRKNHNKREILERILAEYIDTDPEFLIIDIPPLPKIHEGGVPILTNNRQVKLRDISEIMRGLDTIIRKMWDMRIYADTEVNIDSHKLLEVFFTNL